MVESEIQGCPGLPPEANQGVPCRGMVDRRIGPESADRHGKAPMHVLQCRIFAILSALLL